MGSVETPDATVQVIVDVPVQEVTHPEGVTFDSTLDELLLNEKNCSHAQGLLHLPV